MARILEDDAKRLLRPFGIQIPEGRRAVSPEDARSAAAKFGGSVVVKALIPTGKRGKANLITFADTPDHAATAADTLLGQLAGPFTVDAVLVERQVPISREYYCSFAIDANSRTYTMLLSAHGGVDVEDRTSDIVNVPIRPGSSLSADDVADAWKSAGVGIPGSALIDATIAAFDAYVSLDATLLELNPLAITEDDEVMAIGVMVSVDDAALRRHPDVSAVAIDGSERSWRPETSLEARVSEIAADPNERGSIRYLELDGGDIGFLCGGGGASLLLFDALVSAGGHPANYSEFGGNPTEKRVYDLTRVVLSKPGVRGLFVAHNITNNTQIDVVARGVTTALRDAGLASSFPVVAREVGVNDDEGRRIFEDAGVEYLGLNVSLTQAAARMAERMRAGTRT